MDAFPLWPAGLLLIGGGLIAGMINTLAGGASSITVPLLVLLGLPGTVANGTNRIGVFVQCLWASLRFRAEGVPGFSSALPVLIPIALGSAVGASFAAGLTDETFERLFGIVMMLLLLPILTGTTPKVARRPSDPSRVGRFFLFLAIGIFGGAFQAGVGLLIIMALSYAGYDLVKANSIKVVINTALTAVALPIFIWRGQVEWIPALYLTAGFIVGSTLGVRLAVQGGERVIRPVIAFAVLLLAGKMFGLY